MRSKCENIVKEPEMQKIKMYGLYRRGQFTGVVATKEEDIINYLNETYKTKTTFDDGTIFIESSWSPYAFSIREMEIKLA